MRRLIVWAGSPPRAGAINVNEASVCRIENVQGVQNVADLTGDDAGAHVLSLGMIVDSDRIVDADKLFIVIVLLIRIIGQDEIHDLLVRPVPGIRIVMDVHAVKGRIGVVIPDRGTVI
jgi:hypothetical protein